MVLPGSFASIVPPGDDAVPKQLADLTRQIRELGPSIAESFAPVIQDLQAKQAELEAQQDAIEAQQAVILDLVNNQMAQRSSYENADSFALTTSPVTFCSHTITIPTGYTDGAYSATGSLGIYNTSGSTQYVYLRVYATAAGYSAWGSRQQVAVASGFYATLSATLIREYDVPLTPGASVTFYVEAYATAPIAADASNYAFCEELVTFTR